MTGHFREIIQTGYMSYDEYNFELNNTTLFSKSFVASWEQLEFVQIQEGINVIVSFGKNGFVSISGDNLKFIEFIWNMLFMIKNKGLTDKLQKGATNLISRSIEDIKKEYNDKSGAA